MRIKQKFLDLIRKGIKKHEYRLNDEFNSKRNINDEFLLVSNENEFDFLRVKIIDKKIFKNWSEALKETWQNEFNGLYSNLGSLIEECEKFYSKSQISKYGIVRFLIEPINTIFKLSKVLLDTNIIIQRESHNNVDFDTMQMYNWFEKLNIKKFIHPSTKDEISKYKDGQIKENMLKKLSSYTELISNVEMSVNFKNVIDKYPLNENSIVDNNILFQAFNKSVDFVITNDKQIHDKANLLEINDRVLSVSQSLKKFEDENPSLIKYEMLSVKLEFFGNINLNDNFFDTLREDYPGFNNWFKGKSNEQAYVYRDNNMEIKGFLYLKPEDENEPYSDIEPIFAKNKRLKVGTFKVERTGFRLGERFIKTIFDNAIKNKVNEIYVTLFDKRKEVCVLRSMLEKWGFTHWGKKKSNNELVYVKKLNQYDVSKTPKFNFPNVNHASGKFFLPILPEFHTKLFPDSILKTEDERLYTDNLAHFYSLEKVYVSGAFDIKAKPGDIIFIYRIGERLPKKFSSVITSICVLEEIISPINLESYLDLCSNKSIFSENELINFWNDKKYRKIIKLIYYKTLDKKVILDDLLTNKIVIKGGARPFDKITDENAKKIILLSKGKYEN